MSREFINPSELFPSQDFGFSQVVSVPAGRTVYVSGQVARDEQHQIVGQGDFATQIDYSFRNLERALAAADSTLADVVSMRIYVVPDFEEVNAHISAALKKYFEVGREPTTSWVGVRSLANPDFLVEVEALAVVED